MASAVEDRIKIAAPGAFQQEDFRGGMDWMVTDWNGLGSGAGALPVPELLDVAHWMDTTNAGACLNTLSN